MKALRLLIFAVFLGAMACGPSQRIPEPKPLPSGVNFAGVWYSEQFEHMYLRQTGDRVNGIYTYKEGGTIDGTVNGNLLKFTWIDPGDKTEARRNFQGKGYLQLVKEGDVIKLKGQWGYNDDVSGAGPWTAEWVRDMDSDDPRNLEEWRENR